MHLALRRFWIQVTADRKRFGILCGMLAVLLLLWARIIVTSNVPRTAVADPPPPVSPTGRPPTSDNRVRPTIHVELALLPVRDPFSVSSAHFPKPTPDVTLPKDPDKSAGQAAENSHEAEARLLRQLKGLMSRFELEAVMQGRPMAIISGRMYELGDWIPSIGDKSVSFQLVEVGDRWAILEWEGRRFELKMEFPGTDGP